MTNHLTLKINKLSTGKTFLTTKLKKQIGKNHLGQIICKHKGGGNKILYRYIDFWYANYGLNSTCGYVISFSYDPNRHSYLALIGFITGVFKGSKTYVIPPQTLEVGQFLNFGHKQTFNIGHSKALKFFPIGSVIYNLEVVAGKGAVLARSPGTGAKIISWCKSLVKIKLPSGIIKVLSDKCFATLGKVYTCKFDPNHYFKAGLLRNLNKRPRVRGVAMNACDHPHGGGEGRSRVGKKFSKTPWGKPTLGMKTTRKTNKFSYLIIKRKY